MYRGKAKPQLTRYQKKYFVRNLITRDERRISLGEEVGMFNHEDLYKNIHLYKYIKLLI